MSLDDRHRLILCRALLVAVGLGLAYTALSMLNPQHFLRDEDFIEQVRTALFALDNGFYALLYVLGVSIAPRARTSVPQMVIGISLLITGVAALAIQLVHPLGSDTVGSGVEQNRFVVSVYLMVGVALAAAGTWIAATTSTPGERSGDL